MSDDPTPLRIAVLDDYQGVARGLADWRGLEGAETVFFHDHEPHIGYVSRATYEAAFPQMVEDIAAWRRGESLRVLEG